MEKNMIYNNKIYEFIYKIINMMYASFLWLLFCLPIVTIGASTTALYYVVNKTIRHERGKIFREFLCSFKENFRQATAIWLILVIVYGIGVIDYMIIRGLNLNGKVETVFLWIFMVFMLVIGMAANYIFPYIARFENKTCRILKNVILLVMMNLGASVRNIIFFIAMAIISIWVPLCIVITPALYMLVLSKSLEAIFRKYMSLEDIEAEEERNRNYIN